MSRVEASRLAAGITAAVALLPEEQRTVFLAVAVEGARYSAVAEQLGIDPAEVERRLAAALASLDAALNG